MTKFFPVGTIVGNYLLAQVDTGQCKWINIKTGNRLSDDAATLDVRDGVAGAEVCEGVILGFIERLRYANEENHQKVDSLEKRHGTQECDTLYLTRYIRPLQDNSYVVDNMKGVTFLIKLDYSSKKILFQYAICDGDNFNKAEGSLIASRRLVDSGPYSIDMINGAISKRGVVADIVGAIIDAVANNDCAMPIASAKKIMEMYAHS